MARNYTQTKWSRSQGEQLPDPSPGVPGVAKDTITKWIASLKESSCEILLNLGALNIGFELPTDHPCSTMGRSHCMHQFSYDLTQKQCCHCEIVIPILDYVELQEEGLV